MMSSVMTFRPTVWFVIAVMTPIGIVYVNAEWEEKRQPGVQSTEGIERRTDGESEDESPNRELCVPDFYGSDTEPKHGNCERLLVPVHAESRYPIDARKMVRYHQSGTPL